MLNGIEDAPPQNDYYTRPGGPDAASPPAAITAGDVVERISFYAPYKAAPGVWLPVIEALKKG